MQVSKEERRRLKAEEKAARMKKRKLELMHTFTGWPEIVEREQWMSAWRMCVCGGGGDGV